MSVFRKLKNFRRYDPQNFLEPNFNLILCYCFFSSFVSTFELKIICIDRNLGIEIWSKNCWLRLLDDIKYFAYLKCFNGLGSSKMLRRVGKTALGRVKLRQLEKAKKRWGRFRKCHICPNLIRSQMQPNRTVCRFELHRAKIKKLQIKNFNAFKLKFEYACCYVFSKLNLLLNVKYSCLVRAFAFVWVYCYNENTV